MPASAFPDIARKVELDEAVRVLRSVSAPAPPIVATHSIRMVPPAAQTHQLIQIVQATCAPAAEVEPLLSGSAGVTAFALVGRVRSQNAVTDQGGEEIAREPFF